MFDVGFWELLFIMVLALLVLGPKRLPGVVNTVGSWAGKARYMARSLRVQIERELEAEVGNNQSQTSGKTASPPNAPTPASPPPAGPVTAGPPAAETAADQRTDTKDEPTGSS